MTPPTPRAPVPELERPAFYRMKNSNLILRSATDYVVCACTDGDTDEVLRAVNAYPSHQLLVDALEAAEVQLMENEHHVQFDSELFKKVQQQVRAALASAGKTGSQG